MTLQNLIESAFADVPHPGDCHITTCSGDEADDITAYFRGRTWRGHSSEQLCYHNSAFSFFTEDALIYYLPAFLIALVEDPETANTIAEPILWMFTAPRGNKQRHGEAFDRLITRLTAPQRDALLRVFQHLHYDVAALVEVFNSHPIHGV